MIFRSTGEASLSRSGSSLAGVEARQAKITFFLSDIVGLVVVGGVYTLGTCAAVTAVMFLTRPLL